MGNGEKVERGNMRSDQNPKVATFVGSTILSTLLDGV
jgi:hypothetical protein